MLETSGKFSKTLRQKLVQKSLTVCQLPKVTALQGIRRKDQNDDPDDLVDWSRRRRGFLMLLLRDLESR